MDFEKLNEQLKIVLNEHSRIANQIDVHPETDGKFAHFHWVYKDNIHFKFSKEFPKNIELLRKCIAFDSEQTKITDAELTKLIKILKKKITFDRQMMSVYDATQILWRRLNNNKEIDYI